jgi:hypothetical protein
MNLIRRWLNARSRDRLERQRDVVLRLRSFVATLGDRLDPRAHEWATENLENAEWEIAIDLLWEKVDRDGLVLSPGERSELEALTNHPGVNGQGLSHGKAHLTSSDIYPS